MSAPIVTLKLNGKSFRCTGKAGRARCPSKNFFVSLTDEDVPLYACCVCGTERFGGHNSGIEEQVPMRNDWKTPGGSVMDPKPGELWTTLHEEYGFNIDVAADAKNAKCPLYLGPEDGSDPFVVVPPERDGLLLDWFEAALALSGAGVPYADAAKHFILTPEDVRVWYNCPYNPKGAVEAWLEKALEQAALGVFSVGLVPMSTSVAWFNDLVVPYAEWHSFRGRIPFEDPEPEAKRTNPKQDNLLVIFDPRSERIGHTAVRDARTGKKLWGRPT